MTHQNQLSDSVAMHNKPSSRFASLRMFKLKPGSGSSDSASLPPPPPPKDNVYLSSPSSLNPPSAPYSKSIFSRSFSSLSPSSIRDPSQGQPVSPQTGPGTPLTPSSSAGPDSARGQTSAASGSYSGVLGRGMTVSPVPSGSGVSVRSVSGGGAPSVDGSTDSSGSFPQNSNPYAFGAPPAQYLDSGTLRPKKSIFKLSSLGKRNKSRKDLSESANTSECEESGKEEGDDGISRPWNFQHHIHVDEGYIGLPPSWSAALSNAGFSEEEITAIHARRQAASAANLKPGIHQHDQIRQYCRIQLRVARVLGGCESINYRRSLRPAAPLGLVPAMQA
ncbi:hypothetical protein J3A83DRAFT_1651036 [Scleroderma citrinum]